MLALVAVLCQLTSLCSHTLVTLPTLSITQCMLSCNCHNKQPSYHIAHCVHCKSKYRVYQHQQFHCYIYCVFYYLCDATCFGVIAIFRELIPMLLKRTTIQQLHINHTYQMCSLQLTHTTLKMLLKMMVQFVVGSRLSHFYSWLLLLQTPVSI